MPTHSSRLLFVCTGNLCRSPMAAALAEDLGRTAGLDLEVRSAGTRAVPGDPAPAHVRAVCRELGLDLEGHRATRLDADLLRWAGQVLVMQPDHGVAARELVPDLPEGRIVHLAGLVGKDQIEDPYGSWFRFRYRAARDELNVAVRRLLGA
jgi:protein arginine phosphatase